MMSEAPITMPTTPEDRRMVDLEGRLKEVEEILVTLLSALQEGEDEGIEPEDQHLALAAARLRRGAPKARKR